MALSESMSSADCCQGRSHPTMPLRFRRQKARGRVIELRASDKKRRNGIGGQCEVGALNYLLEY